MQNVKAVLSLVLLVIIGTSVNAQVLTLNEAVKTALKNSYDIQLVENSLAIAKNNNDLGVAGAFPTITATANNNKSISTIQQNFADPARNTTKSGVDGNTVTAGLTASVVIFNGYRIITTKDRLASIEKQSGLLLKAQMNNTVALVMQQYYNVARQQAYLKTIQKSIDASQQRLTIVKTRQQVGVANQADILQSNLDLNALVQARRNQELLITQSKSDLLRTMVMPEGSINSIQVQDSIQVDAKLKYTGADGIEKSIAQNPQMAAIAQQVDINLLIEKEIKALLYPTLRASTGYNINSTTSAAGFALLNETYGPFLGVNLSIPIYAGSIARKNLKNAKTNSSSAALQYNNAMQDIKNNAYKTNEAYQNSIQQIPVEIENYSMSQSLLDLVMQKYQLGQATMVDVKQAQQSFENAGFRLVSLRYTAKIAEIELKRLSNQLSF